MENKQMMIAGGAAVAALAVVGVTVLLLGSNNIEEPQETETDNNAVVQDQQNIAEIATETSNLSTLVTALGAGELVDTFATDTGNFTVFAPNNTAFADIQSTVDTLLEPENLTDLQNVLQYHVIDTRVLSTDLADRQVVETLNGEELVVRVIDGDVYINDSIVTTADVEASNGVVHIIDKVLVPGSFGTIADTATSTESLSTLVAALDAGDLVSAVADNDATLTVFAPTNAAFADIQSAVDDLLKPENQSDLQGVLQYHVVGAEAFSGGLSDGQVIETLGGGTLTVEIDGGDVYIVAENSRAKVVSPDILTSNGVVHVIDTVLLP